MVLGAQNHLFITKQAYRPRPGGESPLCSTRQFFKVQFCYAGFFLSAQAVISVKSRVLGRVSSQILSSKKTDGLLYFSLFITVLKTFSFVKHMKTHRTVRQNSRISQSVSDM